MDASAESDHSPRLTILAVTQGQWGERIADNVARQCPTYWRVDAWRAPRALPPLIDDPAEFLPSRLPASDLILALGDTPPVGQLIPDIVRATGARAVIAPIDRGESMPPGLVAQLRAWLADLGVKAVFPRPFCSLTETSYGLPPIVAGYQDPLIQEFARHFGRPSFRLRVDSDRRIARAEVVRGSACGCATHVAAGLVGCAVDEAEHAAGMLHHHYPCLAGMSQDSDYHDTLMHVSGHLVRAAVREQLGGHVTPPAYLRPAGRAEDGATLD